MHSDSCNWESLPELTVHHQIVHYICQTVFLDIYASPLFAVTPPAGIDYGIVICIRNGLPAVFALSGGRELESVGIGAEHYVPRYVGPDAGFDIDSFGTTIAIGSEDIPAIIRFSFHKIDSVAPSITDY